MTKTSDNVYFEEALDLTCSVMDKIDYSEEDYFVAVIGRYNEIRKIMKEILMFDTDIGIGDVELRPKDSNGYTDEYILSVENVDGEVNVCCEPIKAEDEYLLSYADEMYILNNCSSKLLPYCSADMIYFTTIGEFEDSCGSDNNCETCNAECNCTCCTKCGSEDSFINYSTDEDGELHGFSASKSDDGDYYSYSFYTNKSIHKNDIIEILKEIGF